MTLTALLWFQGSSIAGIKTITILPFDINAQQDISYMKTGVSRMLQSRLSWKDHVIVNPESSLSKGILELTSIRDSDVAAKAAGATGADYVLLGSITEFAGAFSLDAKVFDINNGTVQAFFGQTQTLDGIIPELNLLTDKINKQIFNRTMSSLEQPEDDIIKPEIRSQRANPELMMRQQFTKKSPKNEKPPFWKFWAKDKPETEDWNAFDDEDKAFTAETERPFWKFWGNDDKEYGFDDDLMDNSPKKRPFWKFWGSDNDEEEPGEWIDDETEEDKPFWKFWK